MPNNCGMQAIELIEQLGGTSVVANLTNVKPPSVSEWKANNRIPDNKLLRLAPVAEARGIASRKILFPNDWQEIWPELIGEPLTISRPAPDSQLTRAAKAGQIEHRSIVRCADDCAMRDVLKAAGKGV